MIAIGSLMLYVAAFAASLGPIFWLLNSEIYPLEVRSKAAAVGTMANWLFNFIVSLTFLLLIDALGSGGAFLFYAAICGVTFFFCLKLVPETMGKHLEDIQAVFEERVAHKAARASRTFRDPPRTPGLEGARAPPRRDRGRSTCATCSPTTRPAASASRSRPAASTSTTRRTGSPTRRSSCSASSPARSASPSAARRCSTGERINVTEDRPVLHVALRMPRERSLIVDGVDVVKQVHEVARPDGGVRASGSAPASGAATPGSRSATSSTSGSAARIWAR